MAFPQSDSYAAASGKPIYAGRFEVIGGQVPPAWTGLTSPLQIQQGQTLDIRPYASDANGDTLTFTLESGTLPSGVTFSNGVFTATGGATLGLSGDLVISADDGYVAPAGGTLPVFGVTSVVGGANLPFAFGHVFAKGDVPAGNYVNSDLTDWQATPLTYWPDGSLRHAMVAGRATCTAATLKSVQLSSSGTARTGTALTEADLAAALPVTTLACGAQTITLASLVGTAAKQRTVYSGPVMSNWLYRVALTGSSELVAWFDVRLYKGGAVEIFPWIENSFLQTASGTADSRAYTLTIGGVQVFNQTINIFHHTRVALVSSTTHSYWSDDPQILPKHDTAYMMATKLVPNYGWKAPTSAAYANSITETFTPMSVGDGSTAMSMTGYQPRIGVHPNNMALFLTSSADPRAYRSMIANGYAAGSWCVHVRDINTNEPMKFSDHPSLWLQGLAGTGGVYGVDASHQPQYAMLPWLVTGRWWFLDEAIMWVDYNYLWQTPGNRNNADGVILSYTNNETRGAAWALMHLAQAAAITPTTHPCYADMLTSVDANLVAYQGRYVTGTIAGGTFVNGMGVLGHYSSGSGSAYGTPNGVDAWFCAPWMEAYMGMAFGEAWNMDLPIANKPALQSLCDHAYKFPVGLFGDGTAGNFNWRRASGYTLPIGTDSVGWPPESWYTNFGQSYTAYCTGYGLNPNVTAAPGSSFFDNESENITPATGEDFTTSFLGMNLANLVYAVDYGAPGASSAYARVASSSSWPLTSNYNDMPGWGLAPR